MAQIYDFPRAARAEHGHGAKKVLAGVRFQWTDPKKFLRPRWRAGGRSVSYVPRFFCRATLCAAAVRRENKRSASAASQNEAEESDESEYEAAGESVCVCDNASLT